ncbi:MAG: pyridoxamine 5'-phosphate oxidase [Alphaproteobacteria bacterium]
MSIPMDANPVELSKAWLAEARTAEPYNYDAAALATADQAGNPSVRMVLLKGLDERGFVFYTNSESRKGRELAARPRASLCFYWKALKRQIRIEGTVEVVSDREADAYFQSRHPDSQLGAWASDQSRILESRAALDARMADVRDRFKAETQSDRVPRPPYWWGYRIRPERVEFWVEGPSRLHDRVLYTAEGDPDPAGATPVGGWLSERLYP